MAVGPTIGGDGTYAIATPRIDKTGSQVVQLSGGRYGENAIRGNMFCAQEPGTGVAPGTAIGTTSCISLYNPLGNNKRFRVNRVSVGYVSGTLGGGTMYLCGSILPTATAPSGGGSITPKCMDVGNASIGTGLVRTGSTVVAPTPMLALFINGAFVGTGTTGPLLPDFDLEDMVVVEPGHSVHLQGVMGAGTSPLLSPGFVWTEEPIV